MNRLTHLSSHFASQQTNYQNNNFAHVKQATPDPILTAPIIFKKDTDPNKVNLGIGAYRDDNGKPFVFPVVRKVDAELAKDTSLDKEYAPIDGTPDFIKAARMALLGWTAEGVNDKRIVTSQSISGTGALSVLAAFLHKYRNAPIYISDHSWPNHHQVLANAGLDVRYYKYYDYNTNALDLGGLLKDLGRMPSGSIVLFQTNGHNPTGVEPTPDQWNRIAEVMKQNCLLPFFDVVYQGFSSGDFDLDGYAVRHFYKEGFQMVVSHSMAKNLGLYGERTGAIHIFCSDAPTAERVLSQLKIVIRSRYSSPPIHGARIATKILTTPEYRNEWLQGLKTMTDRINNIRKLLREALIKNGAKGNWDHIVNQKGWFAFTGLNKAQSIAMQDKYHIYMTQDGRIALTGLYPHNVEYVAKSMKEVLEKF